MTRETKIGLLVGLAFIIVIGILLSDHMTSTTAPPKAPLSVAGANVRESVAAPTAGHAVVTGPAPAQLPIAPAQPVLTRQELAAPPVQHPVQPPQDQAQRPPVQSIQVGPGVAQAQPPITIQQPPITMIPAGDSPITIAPAGGRRGPAHPVQGVAAQHGEEIVTVGETAAAANPPVPMTPLREYKAQSGDSLSKLASRFLGSNSKANREAIIRANATLQQNPDRIIANRTYLIPAPNPSAAPPAAAAPAAAAVAPLAQATRSGRAPAAPTNDPSAATHAEPAAGAGFTWYTVKENDSLWRIASDQLGTGTAAKHLKELNADVLKGNDNLQVGMRLKIPPRPVASAN